MSDDRALLRRILEHYAGRPLGELKRGELTDAYAKLALAFNLEESTPRMWLSRGKIPHHAKRRILRMLESLDFEIEDPDEAVSAPVAEYPPAVLAVLRDVADLHEITKGKGEVWRSFLSMVTLAKTMARRGQVRNQRHLYPIVRP